MVSRVVVTGGAGFIGSCLVRKLLSGGYSVVVLDNFSSGSIGNLKGLYDGGLLEVVEGDIRDRRIVGKAFKGADCVVHLAALIDVEESVKNPFDTYDVNVNGTLNVLHGAVKAGVKRFVFASSTAVYGEANPLPLREDYPPRPVSPYGASKASAECLCEAFSRSFGLSTVVLRFFNVYGPGQGSNPYSGVVARFLRNALDDNPLMVYGDGEQTRDFIYIDDVVRAIMLALEDDKGSGEIFNICTGTPSTINELVQIVKEVAGKNLRVIYVKPRKGDIRKNYGDPRKAEEILGFKAKISLKNGFEKCKQSYLLRVYSNTKI